MNPITSSMNPMTSWMNHYQSDDKFYQSDGRFFASDGTFYESDNKFYEPDGQQYGPHPDLRARAQSQNPACTVKNGSKNRFTKGFNICTPHPDFSARRAELNNIEAMASTLVAMV